MNGTEKGLIIFLVGGVGFFVLLVIFGEFFYVSPQEELRTENTCMELMDMDFNSERECLEFVQSLFDDIEGKMNDPKVQEFLKNYKP